MALVSRPMAYNNIDGVGELGMGVMLLGYAVFGWLQTNTPQNSVWNRMYTFFIFLGVVCAIIHYGTKAIKQRITYPRTGYVQYPKSIHIRAGVLSALVSAAVAMLVVVSTRHHLSVSSPGSLVGLFFAATYAFGVARTVPWKWAVAAIMALGSVGIAFLPASVLHAIANSFTGRASFLLSFALYGVLLLISGAITFWQYVRHTPEPHE